METDPHKSAGRIFAMLCAGYLAANIVLRWLNWPLFHGHGAYGWPQPSLADYLLLIPDSVIPPIAAVMAASWIVGGLVRSWRALVILTVAMLLVLLAIEVDMSWYGMSKRHIGWAEISVFVSNGMGLDFGVSKAAYVRLALLALVHATALAVLLGASILAARWLPNILVRRVFLGISVAVACLFIADIAWVGNRRVAKDRHVIAIARASPLRLNVLDDLYFKFTDRARALAHLNAVYSGITVGPSAQWRACYPPTPVAAADTNVVVVALEGMNKHYFHLLTALDDVKQSSVVYTHHYSTGDTTHYGLLGLMFGAPVLFYGDGEYRQSAYVDALLAHGYEVKRYGEDIASFGELEKYTTNFSAPVVDPQTDFRMVPAISRFVGGAGGKNVAFVFYRGTHWPYIHAPNYTEFRPEVPADFNYSGWQLAESHQQIINRYKNGMVELNDWLRLLLASIDLNKTILVVTGDHGEAMFENGRLSHAAGLWRDQLEVPMYVHFPSGVTGRVDHITSHAQVMPAMFAWLGLAGSCEQGNLDMGDCVHGAFAAHNNHVNTPVEWAFITEDYKVLFDYTRGEPIRITGITNLDDVKMPFSDLAKGSELYSVLAVMKGRLSRLAADSTRAGFTRRYCSVMGGAATSGLP